MEENNKENPENFDIEQDTEFNPFDDANSYQGDAGGNAEYLFNASNDYESYLDSEEQEVYGDNTENVTSEQSKEQPSGLNYEQFGGQLGKETGEQSGDESILSSNISDIKEEDLQKFDESIDAQDVFSKDDLPVNEVNREENYQSPVIESDVFVDETDAQLVGRKQGDVKEMVTVRPVKFKEFEDEPPKRSIKKNLDIMQDISMHISVELGRTKSSIRQVMEMEKGSVVELDKIAGEQVEIYVNDKLVAKGEVIVIEDRFGVRVASTNIAKSEI